MSYESKKGYRHTCGRGSGERIYRPIVPAKGERRPSSRLYEAGHGPYPVKGIYGADGSFKQGDFMGVCSRPVYC